MDRTERPAAGPLTCWKCGREITAILPCPYNRRGLYTCEACCEECHDSEPFPCREYDERAKQKEPITFFMDSTIHALGGYEKAVEKLCALEDQHQPAERFTFRDPTNGRPHPRRGIELVLCRLYDYERGRF